ncbi:1-acylglycerol-3-phosphate O-acyltransferase [Spizellomyces sp. 'palustris']|nr:1-acylglycerol-3-phosphate O-acyltransferase [Spizellomyces sp. 'palustris']
MSKVMEKVRFILRTFIFVVIMDCSAASINLVQYPSLILSPLSRHLYRRYIQFTQAMFGSLIVLLTYLFTPVEIVVTGDHRHLDRDATAVIMANHQIYSDWWWLWILAWKRNAHGSLKIILKESLKFLPVFGWGMQFFEFIFLARKWALDRVTMSKILHRSLRDKLPVWLVIFPEGTIITDDTKEKCRAYAKKMDIPDDPQHVLIPKSTGLYFCLKNLQPAATHLWDITMGYQGLDGIQTPYEVYSLSRVFFESKGPERVHMHVQKFPVKDLPGFNEAATMNTRDDEKMDRSEVESQKDEERSEQFGLWLRKRFLEKDELMAEFYKNGQFTDDGDEPLIIRPVPTLADWASLAGVLSLGAGVALTLWNWWI